MNARRTMTVRTLVAAVATITVATAPAAPAQAGPDGDLAAVGRRKALRTLTRSEPLALDAVRMKKPFSFAGLALAAAATIVLTGCSDSRPPVSDEDTEKMRQYAACMQQYGIDVPVPGEAEPAGGLFTMNTSDPKALAARSACARLEPAAHREGKPDPAEEERVLKLAQCLRAEGIKAKDPAAGELTVTLEDSVTYTQQQLVDAYTTCNKQVPAVSK